MHLTIMHTWSYHICSYLSRKGYQLNPLSYSCHNHYYYYYYQCLLFDIYYDIHYDHYFCVNYHDYTCPIILP